MRYLRKRHPGGKARPGAGDAFLHRALETADRLVDEADSGLEHRLAGEVELPGLGLARDVRGMLVGKGDVTTALALGHGEAFPDPVDRRYEIGAFVLKSLAHGIRVHVASVRQN